MTDTSADPFFEAAGRFVFICVIGVSINLNERLWQVDEVVAEDHGFILIRNN